MDGKYEISVITPFHNVDLRYFDKCVRSMLAQTIGFERIEWIIVMHNCEPSFEPAVRELVGRYPNVRIETLANDAKTPSSPRNYGVSIATAPYIGYLDADDSYHPECLAEAVRNAKETDAQVVSFRRQHELEDESLTPLIEIQMWNQLESRTVIEKGHWDMKRMFSGVWVFATSKIYSRAFLQKHGIWFDETIPYCEDVMYTITTIAHADRICYLPQLVGYHYFINAESLVQKLQKPPETVVAYARGMAKILKTGFDFGIDLNEIGQLMMTMECNFMLNSGLALEHREEIKHLLSPYVYRSSLIPANKAVSREKANYVYNLIREVILNTEDYDRNEALAELRSGTLTLEKILYDNRASDFGEKHHFENLRTIPAYQFHVPLSRLASYGRQINIQVSIGETGILTSNRIVGYLKDGGGIVPYTDELLKPFVDRVAQVLNGHHNLWVAQCELGGKVFNDRTRAHSIGSAIVRGYFFDWVYGGGKRPATFSAPDGAFFSETAEENDYGKMLHYALLDRDIDQIVAADATRLARMFSLLETDTDAVLAKVRESDAARAEEVAAALGDFAAGGEPCLARRLWPKLGRVVACGTGEHAASREAVRRFTGDVTWNNGCVFLPQVALAHAEEDDTDRYVFDGTDCFCEFFQNDTDDIGKPVIMSKLEPGHTYNVIVTNNAGLYRVVTDAEIRVVENGAGGLVVEITQ